ELAAAAAGPAVPQPARRGEDLGGPLVALLARQVAPAAEVGAVEGVGRRDDVPPGASLGEVVEARELAGQLVGLVEGRVDRGEQPEVRRRPGEGGLEREDVGASGDVVLVEAALALAHAQPLGLEEEVEAPTLGGAYVVEEGVDGDLRPRARVGPDRVVVDPREVGAEVDLLAGRV